MSKYTIIRPRSFFMEKAIKIMLEVTYPDLSLHQFLQVKRFQDSQKDDHDQTTITKDVLNTLLLCICLFKQSHTWQFLRDDMRMEIENLYSTLTEINN
jgi:hypothetical protein